MTRPNGHTCVNCAAKTRLVVMKVGTKGNWQGFDLTDDEVQEEAARLTAEYGEAAYPRCSA